VDRSQACSPRAPLAADACVSTRTLRGRSARFALAPLDTAGTKFGSYRGHMVWVVLVLVGLTLPFVVMTGIGARAHGGRLVRCLIEGMWFPITWVAWFVIDNRRAGRRAFKAR
jgi:hypothetical protein